MKFLNSFAVFLVGLSLSLPLAAQKNLLPAAKAALGENVAKSVARPTVAANAARQIAGQAALRHTAAQASAVVPGVRVPAAHTRSESNARRKNVLSYQELVNSIPHPLSRNQQKIRRANAAALHDIRTVWTKNEKFAHTGIRDVLYETFGEHSQYALRNNQIVLSSSKHFFEKAKWLDSLPNKGQDKLGLIPFEQNAVGALAEYLSQYDLVFLGEVHYLSCVQQAVGDLLRALRNKNPNRRVVVFTEFVDLPDTTAKVEKEENFFTYYRRAADFPLAPLRPSDLQAPQKIDYAPNLFAALLKENFEIYPLEDRKLCRLANQEQPVLLLSETSAKYTSARNKSWARTMEQKMAEIRQTDPDALFVVYAGIAHTSWLMPYALPKFFENENRAVVEMTQEEPSDLNTLEVVWNKKHPFFKRKALFFWDDPHAELFARQTGFDYALVVPEK